MDPTNTTVWARKSFIGSVVSCGVDLLSKTFVENQQWAPAVSTISVATDSSRDITNSNQPLLFFHMDPTNTTVWARSKKEFDWVCGVMQG
jgi:hypothetical protein